MPNPDIILALDVHQQKTVVTLRFAYNDSLKEAVKKLRGARWSQSRKFWYISKEEFDLSKVFNALRPIAFIDYSALKKAKAEPEPDPGQKPVPEQKPKPKSRRAAHTKGQRHEPFRRQHTQPSSY